MSAPTGGQRFRWEVSTVLAGQVAALALRLVQVVIVSRALGPAGRGTYALLVLVVSVGALVVGGGQAAALAHHVAARRLLPVDGARQARRYASLSLAVCAPSAAIAYLVATLVADRPDVEARSLALAVFAIPCAVLLEQSAGVLQGTRRLTWFVGLRLIHAAGALLLTIALLVMLDGGIMAALVAWLTGLVLGAGFGARVASDGRRGQVLDSNQRRELSSFGRRTYVANLLQYFNYRFDLFLVGALAGSRDVGLYATAVSLVEPLWFLGNAMGTVVLPRASAAAVMSRGLVRRAAILCGVSTFAAALAAMIVGGILVEALFGEAFNEAVAPLRLLLPGVVLLSAGKILASGVAGAGKPEWNSWNSFVSLLATIALDILLIPSFGIEGAAVASSAVYSLTFLIAVLSWARLPSSVEPAAIGGVPGSVDEPSLPGPAPPRPRSG